MGSHASETDRSRSMGKQNEHKPFQQVELQYYGILSNDFKMLTYVQSINKSQHKVNDLFL
jgi:hypothetical protein